MVFDSRQYAACDHPSILRHALTEDEVQSAADDIGDDDRAYKLMAKYVSLATDAQLGLKHIPAKNVPLLSPQKIGT